MSAPISTDKQSGRRQRVDAVGRVSSRYTTRARGENLQADGWSVIDELYQQGSARIRFPNTRPGPLQAVLLNTAGGLTGDDHIHWSARAASESTLNVSTAACEKIYRTHGPAAVQTTELEVSSNARLEWLPQETILFDGSSLQRKLQLHVSEGADALIAESLVFGRQAMQETINRISVHDRWRIFHGRQLLHAEDLRLDIGTATNAHEPCMLHQFSAVSTVVLVTSKPAELLHLLASRIRSHCLQDVSQLRAGISVLPGRLLVRILAVNGFQLRQFLIPCIELLTEGHTVPAVWKV